MGEIEKIEGYISKTNGSFERHGMTLGEAFALVRRSDESRMEALCLAYNYGLAKGYRAAKRGR